VIYILRDPRTGAIRYVGRTTKPAAQRLEEHIAETKRGSRTPVHRWFRRLLQIGLRPRFEVISTDVEIQQETQLCEGLVDDGALLLNTMPGGPRLKGPIVVDLELDREADEAVADVAHLGLELRQPLNRNEGTHAWAAAASRLRKRTAARVLREIADLIENEPEDTTTAARGPKYELELAGHVVSKLFGYVDVGAAMELRALVDRFGRRRPTKEEESRLVSLLFRVHMKTIPGATELVRRVFPALRGPLTNGRLRRPRE
jgi:hypothetical protein